MATQSHMSDVIIRVSDRAMSNILLYEPVMDFVKLTRQSRSADSNAHIFALRRTNIP